MQKYDWFFQLTWPWDLLGKKGRGLTYKPAYSCLSPWRRLALLSLFSFSVHLCSVPCLLHLPCPFLPLSSGRLRSSCAQTALFPWLVSPVLYLFIVTEIWFIPKTAFLLRFLSWYQFLHLTKNPRVLITPIRDLLACVPQSDFSFLTRHLLYL